MQNAENTDESIISGHLLGWYEKHKRDLPWRKTRDPYKIWLSEIILQQTSVSQGLPYYERFLKKYPSLKELASAPEDDILKTWQGLGYYSRARNLLHTARYIQEELGGKFPDNYNSLLELKGIGPYTAAAISSFVFNENKVVLDGNVKRFISRLYGIQDDIDNSETIKHLRKRAQGLLDHSVPSAFNQAIMELGALCCTPKNPNCPGCPLNAYCMAYKSDIVNEIPRKKKATSKKHRYMYYAVLFDINNMSCIRKRTPGDIWQGLYDFPLLETKKRLDHTPALSAFGFNEKPHSCLPSREYVHVLTHQKLHVRFLFFKLSGELQNLDTGFLKLPFEAITTYPLPRLIDLYLNDLSITLF